MTTREKIDALSKELVDLQRQAAFEELPLNEDEKGAIALMGAASIPMPYIIERELSCSEGGRVKLVHRVRNEKTYDSWTADTLIGAAERCVKHYEDLRAKAQEARDRQQAQALAAEQQLLTAQL